MNRLHVHLRVRETAESVKFYRPFLGLPQLKREPN